MKFENMENEVIKFKMTETTVLDDDFNDKKMPVTIVARIY